MPMIWQCAPIHLRECREKKIEYDLHCAFSRIPESISFFGGGGGGVGILVICPSIFFSQDLPNWSKKDVHTKIQADKQIVEGIRLKYIYLKIAIKELGKVGG